MPFGEQIASGAQDGLSLLRVGSAARKLHQVGFGQ
jgi:hypothetical protein